MNEALKVDSKWARNLFFIFALAMLLLGSLNSKLYTQAITIATL